MTLPAVRVLHRRASLVLLPLAGLLAASPAFALRVVHYNILNYPGSSGSTRAQYFRTIFQPLHADVIVADEVTSTTGPTQFLSEVLEVMEPGQWATVPFIDGNDTDNSLFYRTSAVQFLGQWAFYPNQANLLRYIHVYRVRPTGYTSGNAELRFYAGHLKASTGFESQRLAECTGLRDSMNAMPVGTHAMVAGDLNFYKASSEPGYAKLLETQANNVGRVYDMLPAGDWHDGPTFTNIHTQSPCLSGGSACASGASTGGMDDRFDFILPTDNFGTGQGLGVLTGTCIPVGNDGQHLNKNITDAPTIPEGASYATALQLASDHLPVRVDVQVPAILSVAPSLAFSPVIVGAPTQTQGLTISNPAVTPGDSLNCGFSAPAGFGAPTTLAVAAAGSGPASITVDASSAGAKAGTLSLTSDAPDAPSASVSLTGTVLRHGVPSLDSLVIVQAGAVDFGDHAAGGFATQTVRAFNAGYDALQARVLLGSATITGGAGRFSLVGGFVPSLLGSAGQDLQLAFDDAGATTDSAYTATLTLGSTDESLPGAIALAPVTVTLRALVTGTAVAVREPSILPTSTRLFPPSPNPLRGSTTLRFDLAHASTGNLSVFDLAGRRIATLHAGTFTAGRYTVTWNGRTAGGSAVGSGVYLVRFDGSGNVRQTVRLAVVR